jgi:UDPglucose 6-dehydrogenase
MSGKAFEEDSLEMIVRATRASVIGLGKLGSPLAACLAAKGMGVVGVDADPRKVECIRQGHAPVFEPLLEETISSSANRLEATTRISEAVAATDVTFIVVATPSEPGGGFSLRFVLPVCEEIGRAIGAKESYHLVVLTSTVMPGTTGGSVQQALEGASGKRAGLDFGLCYSPEFIALGSVVHDFLNPDFVLIGESDPRAGETLEDIYLRVCETKPAVARMNFVNAELTKLSVNTYVTTKISFANMLARICERIPGCDVDVVTRALGLDSRIGGKYLKGAVSYGGPCFPRDNLALLALAEELGAPAELAQVTHRFNRSQIPWLADLVCAQTPRGTIGILGLTYKPNTDVIDESVGLLLARELASRKTDVLAYDPLGARNGARALGDTVRMAASAVECIAASDAVVLATPWPEFIAVPAADWARAGRPRAVVDCWRAVPQLASSTGIWYIGLGLGEKNAAIRDQTAAGSAAK